MAVFFDGRCACGRELCDFTCLTYAVYMCKTQNNIGTWQERMKKPITNADRIRAMSDEELMTWIMEMQACPYELYQDCQNQNYDCKTCIKDWLKQEAEI